MAYSEFGTSFKEAYLQWQEDEAARKRAKKARKHSEKVALRGEERRLKRAEEAKVANMMNIIAASKDKPMYEALESSGLPTMEPVDTPLPPMGREEKSYAPPTLADPPSREEAALRPKYQDVQILQPERAEAFSSLTPMEVVKRNMPKGDTVEGLRQQQQYLSKIMGSERAAAFEDEAMQKAKIAAQSREAAEKSVSEARIKREIEEANKKSDNVGDRLEIARRGANTRVSRKNRMKLMGEGGESYESAINRVSRGKDLTEPEKDELYGSWEEGSIAYGQSSAKDKLVMALRKARKEIDAGYTVVNPFNPLDDKARHDHFEEAVDIYRMDDPVRKQNLIEKHDDALEQVTRDRKVQVKAAKEASGFEEAQRAFDEWVHGTNGWISRMPLAAGAARPTMGAIRAEAVRRGVDPLAVFNRAHQRMISPYFEDFNHGVYLKQNWFSKATKAETAEGGQKVPYFTPEGSIGVQEEMDTRAQGIVEEQDIAAALKFYKDHKGDATAALAAGMTAPVAKHFVRKANDDKARGISAHRAQKAGAGMDYEQALSLMNKPPNTPWFTERYEGGESENIIVPIWEGGVSSNIVIPIYYRARFNPDLGRRHTAAEIKAAEDERKQLSGLMLNNRMSKVLGYDVWEKVK